MSIISKLTIQFQLPMSTKVNIFSVNLSVEDIFGTLGKMYLFICRIFAVWCFLYSSISKQLGARRLPAYLRFSGDLPRQNINYFSKLARRAIEETYFYLLQHSRPCLLAALVLQYSCSLL